VNYELPTLCVNCNQRTGQENFAGLSDILLREPCKRTFNERTGTPFNSLEYPTDIVLLVVLWRLRYKLSLHDLAEMVLERGFDSSKTIVASNNAPTLCVGSEVLCRRHASAERLMRFVSSWASAPR
jgi:hypothetical protein